MRHVLIGGILVALACGCSPGTPSSVPSPLDRAASPTSPNGTDPTTYVLTRTRYRMTGLVARRVSSTTERGTATYDELPRLVRTRCRGLDGSGWAVEQG